MKIVIGKKIAAIAAVSVFAIVGLMAITPHQDAPKVIAKPKPALNVTTCKPELNDWPHLLSANGSIVAWQEAIVGAELSGLQLASVLVDVGDQVKKGQLLAHFVSDTVDATLDEQKASLEIASAELSAAEADAERARLLGNRNALSAQQIKQYLTAERSAQARVKAAEARLQSEKIRRRQTDVIAPDDGIISARSATVGGIAQQGQELFRLIRKNRLEWRAEVTPEDLVKLTVKQTVGLILADGRIVNGQIRTLAPTVDPRTRTALVYVDLPNDNAIRPGMFATGTFELGISKGLTLPQSAVVSRNGSNFVFRIGTDNKVMQIPVSVGRRIDDRIEITEGLNESSILIAQGAGFLSEGDTVMVVKESI